MMKKRLPPFAALAASRSLMPLSLLMAALPAVSFAADKGTSKGAADTAATPSAASSASRSEAPAKKKKRKKRRRSRKKEGVPGAPPKGKVISSVNDKKSGQCKLQAEGKGFEIGQPARFSSPEGSIVPKQLTGTVSEILASDLLFLNVTGITRQECDALMGVSFVGLDVTLPLDLPDSLDEVLSFQAFGGVRRTDSIGLDVLSAGARKTIPFAPEAGAEIRAFPAALANFDSFLRAIGLSVRGSYGLPSKGVPSADSGSVKYDHLRVQAGIVALVPFLRNRMLLDLRVDPYWQDSLKPSGGTKGETDTRLMRGVETRGVSAAGRLRVIPRDWFSVSGFGGMLISPKTKITQVDKETAVRLEVWRKAHPSGTESANADRIANGGDLASPSCFSFGGGFAFHGENFASGVEYDYSSLRGTMKFEAEGANSSARVRVDTQTASLFLLWAL